MVTGNRALHAGDRGRTGQRTPSRRPRRRCAP